MAKYSLQPGHNHDEIYEKIGAGSVTDHGALTGLADDDHSQYLNDARHDATARHTLGTVVPHDDHGALSGLADDDHSQYLNNTRYDSTTRHTLGTVVPHDDHGALSGLSDNDHPQYLLAATGKAADSDKLDGLDSTDFASSVAYKVSAFRNNTTFTLTTSGTLYAVPLNQEVYDSHTQHDNSTNPERFVCKKAGVYIVVGMVSYAANATGTRDALLRVNGSTYVGNNRYLAMTSGSTSVPVSAIVDLEVNDYVELIGRQYSGGSLTLYYANSGSNFMKWVKVSN